MMGMFLDQDSIVEPRSNVHLPFVQLLAGAVATFNGFVVSLLDRRTPEGVSREGADAW